ncbi:MAG TPA: 50S ribosomal protein L21 [Candidatus Dojkabacteria bacterium]|nr:50S ribosomal protein L21 [Candidatus Dojkabacteria bacterium]
MANTKETKPKTKTVKKEEKPVAKATPKKTSDAFAVIEIAGVQLKVYKGKEYEVNKLEGKKGDKIEVKEVLLVSDGKDTKIGKPYVDGAVVKLEITSQKKGEKIEGFKYAAKARQRTRYGYRPSITKVIVKSI